MAQSTKCTPRCRYAHEVLADWPPVQLLPGPESPLAVTVSESRVFDALLESTPAGSVASVLGPRWRFLCYATDHRNYLCHGSNDREITRFDPRPQIDGVRRLVTRVFATNDGIWPIFFAIVDRSRYVGSLRNRFVRERQADGHLQRQYWFSINQRLVDAAPWCDGAVYLLPRDSFTCSTAPDGRSGEEWSSEQAVAPRLRVDVSPEDFPYLSEVRVHDDGPVVTTQELWVKILPQIVSILEDHDGVRVTFVSSARPAVRQLVTLLNGMNDILTDVTFAFDASPALRVTGNGAAVYAAELRRHREEL
jgi:hypothetical protein